MKRAFKRFLVSLSILLLALIIWTIFEARRTLINPNAQTMAGISDSAIILFRDQGDICFFVDEQTGKARAQVTTSLPVPLAIQPLYQSAACKARGSIVSCSVLVAVDVKKEPIYIEPGFARVGTSALTGPIRLQEGTYDVYIGEKYQGRMIVTIDKNWTGPWCKSPLGTIDFTIPPTPTQIPPGNRIAAPIRLR